MADTALRNAEAKAKSAYRGKMRALESWNRVRHAGLSPGDERYDGAKARYEAANGRLDAARRILDAARHAAGQRTGPPYPEPYC